LKRLQEKVVYWTYEIVTGGRHRRLGFILVTRRAAEVAKAVLSQCSIRIIFKMVDPADFSWLRESGLKAEQVARVKKLPQGMALAIGVGDEPEFIKVRPRNCTHGGSTPIAKTPVETPELAEAVSDLANFIKAAPTPEIEAQRETMISTKRLSEWSRQLLERGLKAYEKAEMIHLKLSKKCTNSC